MSALDTPTSTRERIVEAARLLFWDKGFANTSLAEVKDRAQVNPGSLYHFFRTKEALLLAVLDRYMELLWPVVVEPVFVRVKDPIERIFGILAAYRQGLVYTGCTRGCPIGDLALEIGDVLPRAREKIAQNFDGWKSWVARCVEEAAPRLPREVDAQHMAAFILTIMEGGMMQARAHLSIEPFDACVAQLRDYFDRLVAAGAREKREYVQ
jgi:TetR/AcrR family transcriptional regulator, transcriptional repressor for nem operon